MPMPPRINPRRRTLGTRMISRQRFPRALHDILADAFEVVPGRVEEGFGLCAAGFEAGEVGLALAADGAEVLMHAAGSDDGAA